MKHALVNSGGSLGAHSGKPGLVSARGGEQREVRVSDDG